MGHMNFDNLVKKSSTKQEVRKVHVKKSKKYFTSPWFQVCGFGSKSACKKSKKYFTIGFTIGGFKPMVLEAHGIFPWYLQR
jgi:hypothetical protein